MVLTDAFIKLAKPIKPDSDTHADSGGKYLFLKAAGKYWRLGYRYMDKRKTLSLAMAHYAAITESKQAGALMRSIFTYTDHPYAIAALKLSPLLFVRPGKLRAAESSEIDLDAAEWRISGSKMKMKLNHLVPLSTQAVEVLRAVHDMNGDGQFPPASVPAPSTRHCAALATAKT